MVISGGETTAAECMRGDFGIAANLASHLGSIFQMKFEPYSLNTMQDIASG